jgi:hypothetical protein
MSNWQILGGPFTLTNAETPSVALWTTWRQKWSKGRVTIRLLTFGKSVCWLINLQLVTHLLRRTLTMRLMTKSWTRKLFFRNMCLSNLENSSGNACRKGLKRGSGLKSVWMKTLFCPIRMKNWILKFDLFFCLQYYSTMLCIFLNCIVKF